MISLFVGHLSQVAIHVGQLSQLVIRQRSITRTFLAICAKVCVLACLSLMTTVLQAATIEITPQDDVKKALSVVQPGDVVLFKEGDWVDVEIKLHVEATAEQPVVLKSSSRNVPAFVASPIYRFRATTSPSMALVLKTQRDVKT